MAIDGSRSVFPNNIDTFIEYVDLSPSELTNAQRWQELKLKTNKTSIEIEEFNTLTTQLTNKIFTPESLNKLQDIQYNLEVFFKNNVEGYIANKQIEFDNTITTKSQEFNNTITTKSQEFDAILSQFSDKGLWSNTTTYVQWNTVEYDNELYISKQNNNLNHIPVGDLTDLWWRKIAKRGIQGVAGIGLSFVGNYDNSFMYAVGNAVRYNNNIYYCINDSLGNLPTNTSYWQLFLSNSGIVVQSEEPTSVYLELVWIDTSTPNNEIKFWDGIQWVSIGTVASKVSIVDSGNIITATNVEDALQEIVNNVDAMDADLTTLEQSHTTHLAEKANNPNDPNIGIHGLRVQDGQLQYYNGTEWVDVGDSRTHQWCPDFSGAILNNCYLDNGDIALETNSQNKQLTTSSGNNWNGVSGSVGIGLRLTSVITNNIVGLNGLTFNIPTLNSNTQDLVFEIYDTTTGISLHTQSYPASNFIAGDNTIQFSSTVPITPGNTIDIRISSPNETNAWRIKVSTTDVIAGAIRIETSDGWSTTTEDTGTYPDMIIKNLDIKPPSHISGTIIENVALDSIYEWKKYYRKATTGVNNSVSAKITAPIDVLIEQTSSQTDIGITNSDAQRGQSFVMTKDKSISTVVLKMKKIGSPDCDINIEIQTDDGAGNPSGTVVSDTVTISASNLTTEYYEYEFEVNTSALTAESKYHIVCKASNVIVLDTNNWVSFHCASDVYSNGYLDVSNDGGATWTQNTSYDMYFKVINADNLISNLNDKDNINTIDARTHKSIRLVHTLTRNSISDPTPKLHYREVTYQGEDYLARDTNNQVTL